MWDSLNCVHLDHNVAYKVPRAPYAKAMEDFTKFATAGEMSFLSEHGRIDLLLTSHVGWGIVAMKLDKKPAGMGVVVWEMFAAPYAWIDIKNVHLQTAIINPLKIEYPPELPWMATSLGPLFKNVPPTNENDPVIWTLRAAAFGILNYQQSRLASS
jgi:hypothetical protein